MIGRGDVCWVDFRKPVGSEPGYRRALVVVSDDNFNQSRISTVVGAVVTSNLQILDAPGNVALLSSESGLAHDSVINVSHVITIDKAELSESVGTLSSATMGRVEHGLRLVLGLSPSLHRW